jgi:hypothetical protein
VLRIARKGEGDGVSCPNEAGTDRIERALQRALEDLPRGAGGREEGEGGVGRRRNLDLARFPASQDLGRARPETRRRLALVVGSGLSLEGDRDEEPGVVAAALRDRRDPARERVERLEIEAERALAEKALERARVALELGAKLEEVCVGHRRGGGRAGAGEMEDRRLLEHLPAGGDGERAEVRVVGGEGGR